TVRLTTLANQVDVASLAEGGVLIPAGQSSADFSIGARFDGVEETANEDMVVAITDPMPRAGAQAVTLPRDNLRRVTVPIANANSLRTLTVTGPATLAETDADLESGNYTITLAGAAFTAATTVTWTVSHAQTGGTSDADFAAASDRSGTVTFASTDGNNATRTFTLTIAGDDLNEATETFSVQASVAESAATAGTAYGAAAVTTIADDDPISVTFARRASPMQAASVGESASLTVQFAVGIAGGTRSGAVTLPFTLSGVENAEFAITAPGGIAADATGGTLTLGTSDTSVTSGFITVTVTGNDRNEATRTLTLTGGTPGTVGAIDYASASANTAEVMITDDDDISVTLARSGGATGAVREGATADFTIALTRSGGSGSVTSAADICVGLGVVVANQQTPANTGGMDGGGADIGGLADCDGMAVALAVADSAGTGGVRIAAGESSAVLRLSVRLDSIDEGNANEELRVTLGAITPSAGAGSVTAAAAPNNRATAELQNVSSLRTLTVSGPAAEVNEDGVTGAGETATAEFTITMEGAAQPTTPVMVRWRLNLGEDGSIAAPASGLGRSVEVSDVSSPQTGTVIFGTGEPLPITRMVSVAVQQDALNEGAETLRLTLDPVLDDAGGQPDPNVPGTRIAQASADATVAASDDITVFLTAAATGAVTSGQDARYTLSFGTTTVNGAVVPIVPTTPITVPLSVRVGGAAVTLPDVVVQPGMASAPVVIPAAVIDAGNRDAATAMLEVSAQPPTGAPGGATARVANMADITAEESRGQTVSITPPARQVAGWTVALSQPSSDAPEGATWRATFSVGGDTALLAANGLQLRWSLEGRAIGGAEAAAAADFLASAATPPAYTCGANAQGVCATYPEGVVIFSTNAAAEMGVEVRIRDNDGAEGNAPQGFRLTLDAIEGANAMRTVRTGGGGLDAAIPALRANLSVADAAAAEGESAEFVLTLSGFNGGTATTQPITVAYALLDGPAAGGARSGADFTPPATPAGVANCPAGSICTLIPVGAEEGATHRIAVPLLQDGVLEPRETFTLTITGATGGGGTIRLVADPGAASPTPVGQLTATGTITDDADQGARRRQRVSALVTVLDRQTALLATDAISARLSRPRTDGAQPAPSLSIANRNLITARSAARSGSGAAGARGSGAAGGGNAHAPNIGLALYGAAGQGGAAAGLPGGK
ncbi:MAG: hypothetical protein OXU65_10215, partial [Deltaproteobacteria bacterium]|nr:hypothetical protein [Deltaproteobacteria bacterium]